MADHEINEVNFVEPPAPRVVEQDHEVNAVTLRGESPAPPGVEQAQVEQDDQVNTPVEEDVSTEAVEQELPESDSVTEEDVSPAVASQRAFDAWQYAQIASIQAFFWLHIFWNALTYVAGKTAVVSKSVLRGLQSKTYIFFKNSNYPYRLQDFTVAGPGIAPVEWFYDADKKHFISSALYNTTLEYTTHHTAWLAGEIKYNDLVLYDISDYLEEVKWAGSTKPSVAHVLSAWSLHSGIVLNGRDGLSLHTINEDGTESVLPFCV